MYRRVKASIVDLSKAMVRNRKVATRTSITVMTRVLAMRVLVSASRK